MEKLKFRTRLIIGFSVIIVFSFIIGVLAIIQIYKISSDTESIYRHPLAVSNSVRDINMNINGIHRSMKDVVLAEDEEQLEDAVRLVNHYDSLIYVSFNLVEERFLGDKKIVKNTFQTYKDWSVIKNEVIELKKAGKDEAAISITKGKGAVHVDLLLEKTKYLTDFAQNKADQFYQNTIDTRSRSIKFLLIIIAVLLVLSIIISYLISKSISTPIHRFISEIKLMYKKKERLQERKSLSGSEQQILSDTVLELKAVLDKLEGFNVELEEKVVIRTKELAWSEDKLKKLNLSLEDKVNERTSELMNSLEREKESSDLKTQFVTMASHEFRTPLTVINSSASLIEKNTEADQQGNRVKHVSRIKASVTSLKTILNDFLTLGKIEDGKLEIVKKPVNIKELAESIITEVEETIKKNQKTIHIHEGSLDLLVDDNLLRGVLVNLLSNAIKYSEKDIEITTKIQELDLVISVRDYGIGIPENDKKMIFTRFFRAENVHNISGTGLGLNIVKQYVSLLGGRIQFTSTEGEGTIFTVHCPLY